MSRSYDIFLSHSGTQKDFVEHLNVELARVCGHYSVFFDRDAIEHGEQISTSILEYARTCKLAVAVVSEEYFTLSRPPMMELTASYTAAKAGNGFPSLPCLLPVFLALRPEDAKDPSTQSGWRKMWQKWEVNEKMSERRKSRPRRVQPTVWKEAVDRLLDTRGPIYIPEEYAYDPEVFLKKVAQVIARKLDDLNGDIGPSKVGDQLMPPCKEVDPSEDTGVEEHSSENSVMNLGLGFNRVVGKAIDEKEALPEPYSVVVSLEFGSTSSSFSFSHISSSENIYTHYEFPGSGKGNFYCRTMTGIYYSSRDGGQSYEVESWGNAALSSYEQGQQEAGRSSEDFVGIYVTRFTPHLQVRDTQISSTKKLKFPYSLSVDRPITDYLHEFGAYILQVLQNRYRRHLTMKMIRWCVPFPSSWDNAAQEKMKTCMESAGLIKGVDGSPYPVKMVGELEAASFDCLKRRKLQRKVGEKFLIVDIGESFFEVVVLEVVSVCNHIHRVKEVSSRLFTRHSSPDTEFVSLLHRKIGPCFKELLTEHPTECKDLIGQWDLLKHEFGYATCVGEPIEMQVSKRLVKILERYDKKRLKRVLDILWDSVEMFVSKLMARNLEGSGPTRVPGMEWASDEHVKIEIPYRECQSLFDPVIEELLSCISTEVGGIRSLVLVGNWLAGSPYVLDNIRQRFSSQVPEITSPLNLNSATCQGAVALARDLCNAVSSTS